MHLTPGVSDSKGILFPKSGFLGLATVCEYCNLSGQPLGRLCLTTFLCFITCKISPEFTLHMDCYRVTHASLPSMGLLKESVNGVLVLSLRWLAGRFIWSCH